MKNKMKTHSYYKISYLLDGIVNSHVFASDEEANIWENNYKTILLNQNPWYITEQITIKSFFLWKTTKHKTIRIWKKE